MKIVQNLLVGALLGALASTSVVQAQELPGRSFKDVADACNAAGCGNVTWDQMADATRGPRGLLPILTMSPFLRYEIARDPLLFPYNDGAVCNNLRTPAASFASPRRVFEGLLEVEPFSTNITFDVGIDGRIQSNFGLSQTGSNGAVWYAIWVRPSVFGISGTPDHFGYVIGSGEGTNSVFGRASTSGSVPINLPIPQGNGKGGFLQYEYRVITWAIGSPSPLYVIQRAAACQPRLLLTSGFDFGASPQGESTAAPSK